MKERKTCNCKGGVVGVPEEVGKEKWGVNMIYFIVYKYGILKKFINKLIFEKRKLF